MKKYTNKILVIAGISLFVIISFLFVKELKSQKTYNYQDIKDDMATSIVIDENGKVQYIMEEKLEDTVVH
jgi:exosome complex RNA-binding protein Rrp4